MPQYALSNVIANLKIGATTYTTVVELTAPEISVTINEHTPFGGDGWVRKTASIKNVGNITASLIFSETLMDSLMDLLTPTGSGYQAQASQACEIIFGPSSAEGKFEFNAYIASITPPPSGAANEDARIQISLAVDGPITFTPSS